MKKILLFLVLINSTFVMSQTIYMDDKEKYNTPMPNGNSGGEGHSTSHTTVTKYTITLANGKEIDLEDYLKSLKGVAGKTTKLRLLNESIEKGYTEAVRIIVKSLEDKTLPKGYGVSPLVYAVITNQFHMLEILVESGFSVKEAERKYPKYPLLAGAIYENNIDMAFFLIKHGAMTDNNDKTSQTTPFNLAYLSDDNILLMKAILNKKVNFKNKYNQIAAIMSQDMEIVQGLIDSGEDLNITGYEEDELFLLTLVRMSDFPREIIEALITAGANPFHKSNEALTVEYIVHLKDYDLLNFLLDSRIHEAQFQLHGRKLAKHAINNNDIEPLRILKLNNIKMSDVNFIAGDYAKKLYGEKSEIYQFIIKEKI